jgi:hypothetical protein
MTYQDIEWPVNGSQKASLLEFEVFAAHQTRPLSAGDASYKHRHCLG